MKIVSLNIWNGGKLFDEALSFLVKQQADIYFLQEVYNGRDEHFEKRFRTADLVQKSFPDYHAFFTPVYSDTRKKEGDIDDGQMILSRFPLNNKQFFYPDIPYGRYDQDGSTDFSQFPMVIQKAIAEIKGKNICLMNVHGPVNYDGLADSDRRQKMRQVIEQNIEEYSIVGGDFNVRPQSKTIKDLEQRLVSVFGEGLKTTFNVSRKDIVKHPGFTEAAVDMMFTTANLKVLSKQCPQVDVSDHLPLVVEIE